MSCETLLPKKYEQFGLESALAPRGNLPDTPIYSPDADANPEYELRPDTVKSIDDGIPALNPCP